MEASPVLHIIDGDCGLTVIVQQGERLFIYDAGYKSEKNCDFLVKALNELIKDDWISEQCINEVGVVFSHNQPGVNDPIKNGILKQAQIITPANISPSLCLENAKCKELSRLPLDQPNTTSEDSELLNGVNVLFHFNRRYSLIKYHVQTSHTSEKAPIESAQHSQAKEQSTKNAKIELNSQSNDVLVCIKPNNSSSSVLITGKTPVDQFTRLGTDLDSLLLSVFMVPHRENQECLSLLSEEIRKQLTDPVSLQNAALHLALYHKRKSLLRCLNALKHTQLEEKGKSFHRYYHDMDTKSCNPEAELQLMLQDPNLKLCTFFQSVTYHLKWYKKQCHGVFADVAESVSKEEGKQYKRLVFLRNSLAWAHFYKHVHAEVFVMSAEDLKQETELEVLNGIIIASLWKNSKCCIVITGSLSWPLDKAIQRDVRKLAFFGSSPKPTLRVGLLDTGKSAYFTVNPWHQTQQYESSHHIVSVDSVRHTVTKIGNEPAMQLITDDMDITELISTKESEDLIYHLKYNSRPRPSKKNVESVPLVAYLKRIGFKTTLNGSYKVSNVLDCLLGPLLVQQLKELAANLRDVSGFEIIPALLEQNAHKGSTFTLSPAQSSASSADVVVSIPPQHSLLFEKSQIQSAKFLVTHARTIHPVHIILKLTTPKVKNFSLDFSKYLDFEGSLGTTLADHVYNVCYEEDAWLNAKKGRTVGEILNIFLHEQEKALLVVQSLPLFLSFQLIKCKINHYLTTILVDSTSQALQEAHVYVDAFDLAPVSINGYKQSIQISSLAMHLFPLRDLEDMVEIEGKGTLNKCIAIKFTSFSTADSCKCVRVLFDIPQTVEKVCGLFGVKSSSIISDSICGCRLVNTANYSGGFVLSQVLGGTAEYSLTSIFFCIELKKDSIRHNLPPTLGDLQIENARAKIAVHSPFAKSLKLELEISLTLRLNALGSTRLDCQLAISPSAKTMVVKLSDSFQDSEKSSSLSVISAVDNTLGKEVEQQLQAIPTVGTQILNNISFRKMVLTFAHKIEFLDLHVTLSELDIIPGKLSIRNCTLKIQYSTVTRDLIIECDGSLIFLEKYHTSVQFSLPTAKRKGRVCFENYDGLKLKDLLQKFGWLTSDTKSNHILNESLDIVVRKVDICLCVRDDRLCIEALSVSIFKEQLDIGMLTFRSIDLDVTTSLVKSQYITSFSLGAFLSDALYAQLKYDPEKHCLSGQVKVNFSKFVSATDVLPLFQASSSSYEDMKSILKDEFMEVFDSNLKITAQPGLTALLRVSISLPSKHSSHYSLERLELEVKDALKISCKNSYILAAFRFEYVNQSSQESTSTSHLFLEVHKLNTTEDMILDFNLTKTANDTSITASVEAGPKGGFLKLSSAIDLARASLPEVPKFDVGLPKIFDIELLSGSITFQLKPLFRPAALDINICINQWQLLNDPKLLVNKIVLKTTWKSGTCPQLTFTDCSLNFLEHELSLSGKLTSEEVFIECCSTRRLSSSPAQFQSILNNYTPCSQPQPVVPADIGLPNMAVEIKTMTIHLKETSRKFCLKVALITDSPAPWTPKLGSQSFTVREIGGALEWTMRKNKKEYKACLFGKIELFGVHVDMEMVLGKNIDSIVIATVTCPQSLHYGRVADNIVCSEAIVPNDQYNPNSSGLSELVPTSMQGISLVSASTALNLSKKQFFLSSQVQEWGTGSLLMGYLVDKKEMDYIVSLSLESGTKFSKLSQSLAFIDELIILRSMDLLVSSCNLRDLSVITNKFRSSFSQAWVQPEIQKPFYETRLTKLAEHGVRAGTTIYAQIDIARSKGVSKLLKLGESGQPDISMMAYIGTASTETDIEIRAWIPRILLFGMLEFSDIHLLYRVKNVSEFKLTGRIALYLNLTDTKPCLNFDGQLLVRSDYAEFHTKSCGELLQRPCGINVCINQLELAFKKHYDGTSPDITVAGRLRISAVHLSCHFHQKGTKFKLFLIKLENKLSLSALLKCYSNDWPIELDFVIQEGEFFYCNEDKYQLGTRKYPFGYHLEAVITLLNSDFRIEAHMPNRKDISLSGRSLQQIDFFFAKITGEKGHTHEGPKLEYKTSEKSLALFVGVKILNTHCFYGELKYFFGDKPLLEGTIKCPLKFLWINEPSIKVQWSTTDGFKIVEFNLFGDVPGFSLLEAIGKIAKVIVGILSGGLSYEWELGLRTEKNPDSSRYLVHFVLYGKIIITWLGLFKSKPFDLPGMHILLPRVDDFSVSKLPKYILKALWDSIGYTIRELLAFLNPFNLLKKAVKWIWDSAKGVVTTVVNVCKKVGQAVVATGRAIVSGVKRVWRGFCSWFGRSAFIVDNDNGMVLGYICGGRAGKTLCDFVYIVEQFGPVVTVNAVGSMAHDIHKYLKSCVTAREYENEDDDESHDEVDSENFDIEESLKELKDKADELSQTLTFVAGNVLTVTDVSVSIIERETTEKDSSISEGPSSSERSSSLKKDTNISVEWSTYNPEEDGFYNEDLGDIEYHIKIIAVVIRANGLKIISIYDNVFTDQKSDKSNTHGVDKSVLPSQEDTQQKAQLTTDCEAELVEESQDTLVDQVTSEEHVDPEQEGGSSVNVTSSDIVLDQEADETAGSENINEDTTITQADEVDSENENTITSTQADINQEQVEKEPPKRIKFEELLLDPEIQRHAVCFNVSIQPTVTFQVKMLPPDKIASEKYRVDPNRLADGDKSWMDDMKKEIEASGRMNEITLEGGKICEQYVINQASTSTIEFTAECIHKKDGLTVTGDISVPISGAHMYLVQLIDEADKTIIIKQCRLFTPSLHFSLEASIEDFPKFSLGPYYISIIALDSNFGACSAFSDSELKISRYSPPAQLGVHLPNLDSSDSDTVCLEWKHSEFMHSESKEEDDVKDEGLVTTDSQKDDQTVNESEQELNSSENQEDSDVTVATDNDDEMLSVPTILESSASGFYTISIRGVPVKKPKKGEEYTIENLKELEAFSKKININPNSQKELAECKFNLKDLLENCPSHQLQHGLIFHCEVISNGTYKLHSTPKLFPEFILLAPPANVTVTTPKKRAGLYINWEYILHGIGYRVELVTQQSKSVVFSKVLKCEKGRKGKVILYQKELKDIPCTSCDGGYQLRMYSLGFGHDLIRCLNPTIVDRVLHVIPAKLQYLNNSNVIRVEFEPHSLKKDAIAAYKVELYQLRTHDAKVKKPPRYLTSFATSKNHLKVDGKTVIADFPLRYFQYLLHSVDLVVAWVCSIEPATTCIGVLKEEVVVLDSPVFTHDTLLYESIGTVGGIKLAWPAIPGACGYQYGYFLPDKKEHVSVMEIHQEDVTIDFASFPLERLAHDGFCRFQVYVTTLGKPGQVGALTLDVHQFQCVLSRSVEKQIPVIFTSHLLQQIWTKSLLNHAACNYYSLASNPRYYLFPTQELFPRVKIPKKLREKFWRIKTEDHLFGNHDCLYARDVLSVPPQKKGQNKWKTVDPFTEPFGKPKKNVFNYSYTYGELHLLFYTRCYRVTKPGKKNPCKLDILLKIEAKNKNLKDSKSSNKGESDLKNSLSNKERNKDVFEDDNGTTVTDQENDLPQNVDEELDTQELDETSDSAKPISDSLISKEPNVSHEHVSREKDSTSTEPVSKEEGSTCAEPVSKEEGSTSAKPVSKEEEGSTCAEPVSKEDGSTSAKPATSRGFFGTVTQKVMDFGASGVSKIKAAAAKVFNDPSQSLHVKEKTIDLPYGSGPKLYCYYVRYKPINREVSPKPLISVTIKPNGTCYHEDTHLFVRFADYNYHPIKNK